MYILFVVKMVCIGIFSYMLMKGEQNKDNCCK